MTHHSVPRPRQGAFLGGFPIGAEWNRRNNPSRFKVSSRSARRADFVTSRRGRIVTRRRLLLLLAASLLALAVGFLGALGAAE